MKWVLRGLKQGGKVDAAIVPIDLTVIPVHSFNHGMPCLPRIPMRCFATRVSNVTTTANSTPYMAT
jgi:hypothetical protein